VANVHQYSSLAGNYCPVREIFLNKAVDISGLAYDEVTLPAADTWKPTAAATFGFSPNGIPSRAGYAFMTGRLSPENLILTLNPWRRTKADRLDQLRPSIPEYLAAPLVNQ
jgi:hypothetical protein